MKLELGSGKRPTDGYAHNDTQAFDGVDYVGNAWELDLPDGSVEEVIALGFIEHLTYERAADTLTNVHRMLEPKGAFLFDVPDLAVWCRYFLEGHPDFDQAYILRTLYGWQRWPGDVHQSGWTEALLAQYLADFSDVTIETLPTEFVARGIYRYRFTRPQGDAHWYVRAVK